MSSSERETLRIVERSASTPSFGAFVLRREAALVLNSDLRNVGLDGGGRVPENFGLIAHSQRLGWYLRLTAAGARRGALVGKTKVSAGTHVPIVPPAVVSIGGWSVQVEMGVAAQYRGVIAAVLRQINMDRRAAGCAPAAWHGLAAAVAEGHARDMLAGGYMSHWNEAGLKSYHRYSRADGSDAVSENVSATFRSGYGDWSDTELLNDALGHQSAMMAEQPPEDGHRRNILTPSHTHVGIGVVADAGGSRMVQLFLNETVKMERLPLRVGPSSSIVIRGCLLDDRATFKSIAIYHEPVPERLTVDDLNATASYGLPDDVTWHYPRLSGGWRYSGGHAGSVKLDGTTFDLAGLHFRRGISTVGVWIEHPHSAEPFLATMRSVWCV